jgi:hypothetical protein
MASKEGQAKQSATKRRASGVRIYDDTLRAVRVYAAEHDLRDWEAQDILLRKSLGLPPRKS